MLTFANFVSSAGYSAIFALCVLQSCCVPTSSEITLGFAGVLAAQGKLSLAGVIVVGALGEVVGAYVAWAVGRHAGRVIVDRFGRYVLLSHRDLDRAEAWYDRHQRFGVFGGRLLPVIRNFAALPAGIAEVPLWRFGILTAAGSLIWDGAWAGIGYGTGTHWHAVASGVGDIGYVLAAVAVGAIGFGIYHRYRSYKETSSKDNPPRAVLSVKPRLPDWLDGPLAALHVDWDPPRRQPKAVAVAVATVVAVAASLAADAVLVNIAEAVFPATDGYAHFQFGDYGKLTVIGVVIACAAWPITTRISSTPRWLFLRMAVVVTLVLWSPDLWILIHGQPAKAVAFLMLMHLAIALFTYNALVRLAPAGSQPAAADAGSIEEISGLPNRSLVLDLAKRAITGVQPKSDVSVLWIDLDDFKQVNDQFGRQARDHLLRRVAERLVASVRSTDTIWRVGGDEFFVVLKDRTVQKRAGDIAKRVEKALASPFVLDDDPHKPLNISASIVVRAEARAEEILTNPDIALYTATATAREVLSNSP